MAVLAAAALVAGCATVGWWLTRHGVRLHLGSAYPLSGHYRLHLSAWLAAPAVVGMLIWRYGPRAAAGLGWPSLLWASFVAAGAWAVSLAVVAGPAAIAAPLTTRYEYLAPGTHQVAVVPAGQNLSQALLSPLDVPVADVGGNSKAALISVTGLTVTQLTPSSAGDTIFNQIAATKPFDFKP